MNRPMLTVLALLGLVAGAWLYLSGSSAQDATLDPEADAAATEEAQPALIGSGDHGRRAPPPRTPAESGEPAQPPTRPAKRSAYSVRGTVTGIPKAEADKVRITIRPIDQGSYGPDDDRHVLGTLQADLQFSIDVDTLLVDAGEAALLQIVVDHPRSLAAEIRVDVSARATSATWEVKVALLPAAVVWGFVRDVDDRPVAKAPVAAYAMDGTHPRLGSVLPIPALHSVKTDHTGRYQLRVPGDGSFLVVSFLAPRRPASTTVRLTEGATTHAPPLILRRGVSLTGMASFAGQRLPGASVGARSTLPVGIPLSLGDSYVNWQAGRVVYAERTTRCDANGTFRFEGMLPGDWSLGIFSASISGYDYTSDHMLRASNQVVTVPASEVELTFLGATQRVGVDGLSQTDTHFSVRVNDRGASVVTSVRRGAQARLLLPPGVELELVVTARGYLPTTRTVHTAPAGGERSLRVTLVPEPPRPTLSVRLEDKDGTPVPLASFRVQSEDAPDDTEPVEPTMRDDRGTFLIKRLFPGPAVLTVRPWGERTSESGYGLPITRAIVLPVEGTLSVQLVATRGGRVRVAARDLDRRLVNAQCMIRNSSGAAQRVAFIGQRGSVMMSTTGYLGSLSPALSDPPLPAGTYTISVEHEGVTREAEIVVKPGETTAVNFALGR